MAGDYLFPKRLFKDGEPFETVEVNEAVVEAGERLNGHLNQHNIRAPINASVLAAEGTFYRTFTVAEDVDPNVTHQTQGPQPANAFDVGQNTSWQVIAKSQASSMAVELETGKSMLAMTAHVSHCYQNNDASLREVYRFDMPSYEDFFPGSGRVGYSNAYTNGAVNITVNIFLNSPGTRSYLAVIPAPPPGVPLSQGLAALLEKPLKLYSGAAGLLTGTEFPTVTYSESNTNGGGYIARREGSQLFFTPISSTAATGIFRMAFTITADISAGLGGGGPAPYSASVTGVKDQDLTAAVGQTFSDLTSFDSDNDTLNYFAAQAQYAFRVDGAVISESITGRFDNELRTVLPLIRQTPLNGDRATASGGSPTNTPVSSSYNRFPNRPDAVNIPMYSCRLTGTVEVEPGAHLVELVVRRVPCGKRQEFELVPPPASSLSPLAANIDKDHRLMVYNRVLSVTEVPLESRSTSEFESAVETPTYDDEDVVSRESLYNHRLQPLVDASNDIKTFQLARGAVNGDHLGNYSTVLAVAHKGRVNDLTFFANDNPYRRSGGGSTKLTEQIRVQRAEPLSATDWKKVVEADLSSTISAGTACTLTVEGNVFLRRFQTDAPDNKMHTGGAFFCVALEINGNWFLYLPSQGWVNSNSYFISLHSGTPYVSYVSFFDEDRVVGANNTDDLNGRDYVDVPVTAVLQFPATGNDALLVDITGVAIFGAAAYMTSAAGSGTGPRNQDAKVTVARASVNAVAVKS